MEIPVINGLTPSTINFNNPSLFFRLIPVFDLDSGDLSLPVKFCKWGALFLALAYGFTSFTYRLRSLFLYFSRKSKFLLANVSDPDLLDEYSSDDEEEEDDVCSSSDESEVEEERDTPASSYWDMTRFEEDFRVKEGFLGSGENARKLRLRRRRSFISDNFSLSEFVSGNGVVKLWESAIPSVLVSPSVVFTSNAGEDGRIGLGLWDFRMKLEWPAVQAEWHSDRSGKAVGIDAGKVYVSDDVSMGLTVGDVRRLDTPLEYLTEFGGKLTALF